MLCLKYCPINHTTECEDKELAGPDIFAAWSTDKYNHLASSSGGVFSELAKSVLADSGVVCGCAWGEGWTPKHILIDSIDGLASLKGSKYIPSLIHEGLFREVINLAKEGATVLFCGTPCQVAGLDLSAPAEARANILLVDLVCHGVPSLTSFHSYLDFRFGSRDRINHFSFRNKEISVQTICAIDQSGSKYLKTCGQNSWFRAAMVYHLFLQKICFTCPFGNVPRVGDITLGDFWGIPEEWHHEKGDSLVLANTPKGKERVQHLARQRTIRILKSDYSTASKGIGRIRGAVYSVPSLRRFAMGFIESDNYRRAATFCYVPMRIYERFAGFLNRRLARLKRLIPVTRKRP
jgi:coenzyme F420-reducing hydrogenase beta subunit